jgi:hypothetical protein
MNIPRLLRDGATEVKWRLFVSRPVPDALCARGSRQSPSPQRFWNLCAIYTTTTPIIYPTGYVCVVAAHSAASRCVAYSTLVHRLHIISKVGCATSACLARSCCQQTVILTVGEHPDCWCRRDLERILADHWTALPGVPRVLRKKRMHVD